VIQCITPPGLRIPIIGVVLDVEGIHEVELRRLEFVEYFLVQRVKILSVVNNNLSISCGHEPFVVRFEVGEVERIYFGLD